MQVPVVQYNTILFKHGKNLQFTNGKYSYDKLNMYKKPRTGLQDCRVEVR